MCQYISPINTNTKFIILMHPKEYRKTKNGTGHFTNKSLTNSKLFIGINFSENSTINSIINNKNNECFLLYPGKDSINLSTTPLKSKKNLVVFIIDSTWPCSKKILRLSKNLQELKKISFDNTISSNFFIKTQPSEYCLSTIESTLEILKLLEKNKIENINENILKEFIKPFTKMVEYQIECAKELNTIRYK
ncbi:MAG: tRNA-uridine aminocarboxypropyltransferase [Halarcobacter sp.]